MQSLGFNGKYPLWHLHEGKVTHSVFESGSRAAIWYTRGLVMENVTVDAPKMFRRCAGISLNKVTFSDALETFWDCEKVGLESCHFEKGDYLFMNSSCKYRKRIFPRKLIPGGDHIHYRLRFG